jgi:hypothetical protein
MKKHLLLLFAFISFQLTAQQWGPVGCGAGGQVYSMSLDSVNHKLYLGGQIQYMLCAPFNNSVGIISTDGNTFSDVGGIGLRPFGSAVRATIMFQGKLFIGGLFDSVANIAAKNIACWDGTQWSALSSGMMDTTNSPCLVEALAVFNNELYAAGVFTHAGGTPCNNIAKWNGSAWIPLGAGITNAPNTLREVYCMHAFNNRLYVGGCFDHAGTIATRDIASWDGVAWDSLGPGLSGNTPNDLAIVWALQDYQNELYAGGYFSKAGNAYRGQLTKWNGTSWDSLGAAFYPFGLVRSMTVYRNTLIVAGNYDTLNNVRYDNIAAWDGNAWSQLGGNAFDQDGTEIFSLCVMDSCLYAGGLINTLYNFSVQAYYIAKYCDASDIISVPELNNATGSLSPVPANNILVFDPGMNEPVALRIYDVNGQIVLTTDSNKGKTEIDISSLAPGIYFLENYSTTGTFHYKFVKE